MILTVNTRRNNVAALTSWDAARRMGRSSSARRAVAALSGLGSLVDDQIAGNLLTFKNGLPYAAQGARADTPDQFRSYVMYLLQNTCSDTTPGVDCPGGLAAHMPALDAAVADYSAALAVAIQNARNYWATFVGSGLPAQFTPESYDAALASGAYNPNTNPNVYNASYSGGGGGTAYATPAVAPAPTYPTTIVPTNTVPTGGGLATTPVNTPVQAVVRNLSRPNLPFQVGDMFSLDVQGAPNSLVTISGTQNGVSKGTTPFGNTDGSGRRSITGTMDASTVGSWVEMINVGGSGAAPYTVQFNVLPAPGAPGSTASSGPTGGGTSTATSVTADGTTNTTAPTPAPAASSGFTLSTPVLIGLAAAAFFLFGGKR